MRHEAEKIRYVTTHFRALQGFRIVPAGLLLLFLAQGGERWPVAWQLGALASLGGLYLLIDTYYRRTFGRVERLPTPGREVAFWIGFGAVYVLALLAEHRWEPPFSPALLVLGAFFAYPWLKDRVRPYHALFGAVVGLFGLLPLLPGITRATPWWAFDGMAMGVLLGAGFIITGVLDHLLLVRAMPPAEEVAHG